MWTNYIIYNSIVDPSCGTDWTDWRPFSQVLLDIQVLAGAELICSLAGLNCIQTEGLFGQSGRTAWSMRGRSWVSLTLWYHLPGWPNKPTYFYKRLQKVRLQGHLNIPHCNTVCRLCEHKRLAIMGKDCSVLSPLPLPYFLLQPPISSAINIAAF